jgi:SET domain-containing protein
MFALRDIEAKEELTFEYGRSEQSKTLPGKYDCHCGAPNCRKKLPFNPYV